MAILYLINPKLILVTHATSGANGIFDKRKVKSKEVSRNRSSHKLAGVVGHNNRPVKGGGKIIVNFSPAESKSFIDKTSSIKCF